MSETARTAVYAAAATAAVGLAAVLAWPRAASETAGFEQVGTPFFTAFSEAAGGGETAGGEKDGGDADAAAAAGNLSKIGRFTITAFDPATGEIRDFRVERDDATGLYGIAPYGYPAEAAEQLAEVAAALGSVRRTALQSRRAADWADLGVVDPGSEDVSQLEGRGLRVELTGDDGNTLADLIIGKPVPPTSGNDRDGYFYVREPRDDSTYIARLADLDLSATFADWVDPQVLDLTAADLRGLTVPDERVDPEAGEVIAGAPLVLSRETSAGEWAAADPPAGKTVDQAAVNELARTATGLTITGVRPKPAGLQPDLTLDPEVVRSQRQYQAIVRDVTGKGFSILPTPDGGGQVIGEAGQLTLTTEDGVAVDLDFGELFTGTTYDFAVGDAGDGYKTLAAPDGSSDENAADGDADEASDEEQAARGRYLFVTARVDAAALGDAPVAPEPPPAAEERDEEDGEQTGDVAAADEPAEDAEESAEDDEDPAEPDAGEEEVGPAARYEEDLAAYRTAKAEYDEALAAAGERVEELNRRFGDWYYVVDATDAADLSLTPAALLEDDPDYGVDPDPAAGLPAPVETPGGLEDILKGLSGGASAPAEEPMTEEPAAEEPAAEESTDEEAADPAEAPSEPEPANAMEEEEEASEEAAPAEPAAATGDAAPPADPADPEEPTGEAGGDNSPASADGAGDAGPGGAGSESGPAAAD